MDAEVEKYVSGESGVGLRHNTGRDLIAAISLKLTITTPTGDIWEAVGVIVGASDVTTKRLGLFKGGEYAVYITKPGEFVALGYYFLQWEFDFGGGKVLKPELQILEVEL